MFDPAVFQNNVFQVNGGAAVEEDDGGWSEWYAYTAAQRGCPAPQHSRGETITPDAVLPPPELRPEAPYPARPKPAAKPANDDEDEVLWVMVMYILIRADAQAARDQEGARWQ